jgi:hypothetical protein
MMQEPTLNATVEALRKEWRDERNGFLSGIRDRRFSHEAAGRFLDLMRGISIPKHARMIDRRLVAELWDIPLFLERSTSSMHTESDRQLVENIAAELWEIVNGILSVPE